MAKQITHKELFELLFDAPTEKAVEEIIAKYPEIFANKNWAPLGEMPNNYGVIENQQSSPIAALIEKLTNSIDAILMRKCLEAGIDPKSQQAPKSMEEAVKLFFKNEYKNWDLPTSRKGQAQNIQVVADGPVGETSLIIYDNGEGQHPQDFPRTLLSLLHGNKKDILFVQGTYNMGGSGAIAFCGKRRFQLVGSRKYDKTGDFGFTLVRAHPLTEAQERTTKNTWYEYLTIEGKIPAFSIQKLNVKLDGRSFETGTVIKLFSYELPSGSRSVISRDLNQSINEFLFEPALPVLTVDKKERYPKDRALERHLYGLKRRLEQEDNKYVEASFIENYKDALFGTMKVTCYVFRSKVEGKTVTETRETIQREFFKNNMSVLFSMNGQVHGHFTSEFITRSLKFNILKHHLLIHVDCTAMNYNFRKELFMASRDRLKEGDETSDLRKFLAKNLSDKEGRLAAIDRARKDSITVESKDTSELLRSFTKNMPINSELMKLLSQTFKLEQRSSDKADKDKEKEKEKKDKDRKPKEPFKPQRFPSYFKLVGNADGELTAAKAPLGGERTIRFESDVEDHYFQRVEQPGELKLALLNFKRGNGKGGGTDRSINRVEDVLNINTSSPKDGSIRIVFNPRTEVAVGDSLQIKATLTGAGESFDQVFWVKVSDPEGPKEPTKKKEKEDEAPLGLPEFKLMYQAREGETTWDQVAEMTGDSIDFSTVIAVQAAGDTLERVFINMDSTVLKNFKTRSKSNNEDQLKIADSKYISSVYFHTLFLYTITKSKKYRLSMEGGSGGPQSVELEVYLKDLFSSYYSEFILNFGGANELMQVMSD